MAEEGCAVSEAGLYSRKVGRSDLLQELPEVGGVVPSRLISARNNALLEFRIFQPCCELKSGLDVAKGSRGQSCLPT